MKICIASIQIIFFTFVQMKHVDYIIVGCGLAGIAFCEQLRNAQKSFVVFDDQSQQSSVVAAGLYNPVILKRFTEVWKAKEQLALTLPFYKKLEQEFNIKLDYELPVYRRFASVEEQNEWFTASDKPSLQAFLSTQLIKNTNPSISAPFGFGEVKHTGRVDTASLLVHYKNYLKKQQNYFSETFDYGVGQGTQYDVDCTNEEQVSKLNKYDFVVTSHALEHIANPIKTLHMWKNYLLDTGGYVLSIIPDYQYCFDKNRPLTTLEHLIEDYNSDVGEDDATHIQEQKDLHDWSCGGHPKFYELCEINHLTRVVHHHTFDIDLVEDLFDYCGFKKVISYKHDDLNIVNLSKVK